MTDPPTEPGRPWWQSGAEGLPDVESLLGPEGMAAMGGVADEALKLFVVLRDRFTAPPTPSPAGDAAEGAAEPSAWSVLLGQLAATTVRTVNDVAQQSVAAGQHMADSGRLEGEGPAVLPGEAAACSFCPICQAIALFRSVPMITWQRLAASVIEVADAARDLAATGGPGTTGHQVVVTVEPDPSVGPDPVAEFLRSLAEVSDAPPAAGPPDAGAPEAGLPDAGEPDPGEPDAGPQAAGEPEAVPPDAGEPEAVPPAAGEHDGRD